VHRLASLLLAAALLFVTTAQGRTETRSWPEIVAAARGETVYWNAWGGDEHTNAFIARVGEAVRRRYGITIEHVKLKDTAEAVTRVVAEKAAGRAAGGSADLIWINGPNFLSMKEQGLLFGPFTDVLPHLALVDTVGKPSNFVDFTVPVDGFESPWRLAQIVYVYDGTRLKDPPRSIPAMLDWARRNPGRLTHPSVRNFLGATFLKQALYELTPDPSVLQKPATDANFAPVTAPLWAWYDQLRPLLWRRGQEFPASGPAARQLLNDGEIDLTLSFNPAEAAVSIAGGLLPETARVYTMARGTIGNTSFVAIPYNAAHKEAAMVVADFLLDPEAQARAQNIDFLGSFSVLDIERLPAADKKRFADLPRNPALPTSTELGKVLLEPHASWMTRIIAEYQKRYVR
jgi:putative thiamine transport system substrate-binding protein